MTSSSFAALARCAARYVHSRLAGHLAGSAVAVGLDCRLELVSAGRFAVRCAGGLQESPARSLCDVRRYERGSAGGGLLRAGLLRGVWSGFAVAQCGAALMRSDRDRVRWRRLRDASRGSAVAVVRGAAHGGARSVDFLRVCFFVAAAGADGLVRSGAMRWPRGGNEWGRPEHTDCESQEGCDGGVQTHPVVRGAERQSNFYLMCEVSDPV